MSSRRSQWRLDGLGDRRGEPRVAVQDQMASQATDPAQQDTPEHPFTDLLAVRLDPGCALHRTAAAAEGRPTHRNGRTSPCIRRDGPRRASSSGTRRATCRSGAGAGADSFRAAIGPRSAGCPASRSGTARRGEPAAQGWLPGRAPHRRGAAGRRSGTRRCTGSPCRGGARRQPRPGPATNTHNPGRRWSRTSRDRAPTFRRPA